MKWLAILLVSIFSLMAFGQVDLSPIDDPNMVVGGILQIVSKLLLNKPSLSLIVLIITQMVIMVLRTNWLDRAVGKVKMPIIAGIAIIIPVCTFMVANPEAPISNAIADGASLAALQVFGHQLFLHMAGSKKNIVNSKEG